MHPPVSNFCILLVSGHILTPNTAEFDGDASFLMSCCSYNIYAEGYAWSVSLKYIMACGSLALIIKPQYEDFFSRGLVPKENYWPISPTDLCQSIKLAVEWGNQDPSKVVVNIFSSTFHHLAQFIDGSTHNIIML